MTEHGLSEPAVEALNRLYEEADPPLDFDEVLANPDAFDDDWFRQHTLDPETEKEICNEVIEEYDLDGRERSAFFTTVVLDLGPAYSDESEQEIKTPK